MNLPIYTTIAVALLFSSACNRSPEGDGASAETDTGANSLSVTSEVLNNANLDYDKTAPHEIQERITAYGEVTPQADRMASIVSRVGGIVVEVKKQLGDPVDEGEVVAVLESQTLAEAVMAYLQAETKFGAAKDAFSREKELYGKKLTSAEAYQEAKQALQAAKIAHAAARQSLQLLHFEESELHAYLDKPESADLTRFSIRSPLKGVVTNRTIHRGQAVAEDATLFEVADLDDVCVRFNLPLETVGYLRKDSQVAVSEDSLGQSGHATVTFVSPIASETSRTVMVRASLSNKEGNWRPGTPVSVVVKGTAAAAAVAIPADALLDYEGGYIVFVRKTEGEFNLREVEPGRRDEAFVEIKSGLQPGETVVTTNAFALKALWQSEGA